jgi:hypothetical protein
MDKALPSGGKDSEFESWGGRYVFFFLTSLSLKVQHSKFLTRLLSTPCSTYKHSVSNKLKNGFWGTYLQ